MSKQECFEKFIDQYKAIIVKNEAIEQEKDALKQKIQEQGIQFNGLLQQNSQDQDRQMFFKQLDTAVQAQDQLNTMLT